MIPNPKKEFILDFNIDFIKSVIEKVPGVIHQNKCKIKEVNETFNEYTFHFSETVSAGSNLIVNLTELSSRKTKINLESTRVIGAYNKWYEVQNSNEQMKVFTKAMSILLENPESNNKVYLGGSHSPEKYSNVRINGRQVSKEDVSSFGLFSVLIITTSLVFIILAINS